MKYADLFALGKCLNIRDLSKKVYKETKLDIAQVLSVISSGDHVIYQHRQSCFYICDTHKGKPSRVQRDIFIEFITHDTSAVVTLGREALCSC